ncbi:hypothetical protein DDIC_07610 [Desulfovibrio desulfuricans]|uniref:Uncharacterized protein n=1 Tax=Desulfovibrio desulfuricans TaxID=876 RepID=A0A4P7UM13_DESDE|nr:hypothetical protein [Desulfovibrio desulfuricans]QCC85741.1 hypothetical protein DDIC_07610 [Desulfovibrio desulfuricans]
MRESPRLGTASLAQLSCAHGATARQRLAALPPAQPPVKIAELLRKADLPDGSRLLRTHHGREPFVLRIPKRF